MMPIVAARGNEHFQVIEFVIVVIILRYARIQDSWEKKC